MSCGNADRPSSAFGRHQPRETVLAPISSASKCTNKPVLLPPATDHHFVHGADCQAADGGSSRQFLGQANDWPCRAGRSPTNRPAGLRPSPPRTSSWRSRTAGRQRGPGTTDNPPSASPKLDQAFQALPLHGQVSALVESTAPAACLPRKPIDEAHARRNVQLPTRSAPLGSRDAGRNDRRMSRARSTSTRVFEA